jgi:opacity protein-like surface antigen
MYIKSVVIFYLLFSLFNVYADGSFYLKGGVGLNNIKTTKFSNHDFDGKVKLSNSFPLIEAGIGYKFDNGIRLESVIDYYFLFRTSEISRNPNQDIFKISAKTKADSLMFNIYKDIVTIGNFIPFVGGGIGIGHLKESVGGESISRADNVIYPLEKVSKKRNQFAYKLTIGSDIKFSNTITGEISYNYFNLGGNKRKIIGGIKNIGNRTYEIHNITLGMRFTI